MDPRDKKEQGVEVGIEITASIFIFPACRLVAVGDDAIEY